MNPAIPIILVFVGCCSNVVYLELLITECPGSGNIIAFFQFLFISVTGFVFTSKFGKKPRSVPLFCYVKMTLLYCVNVVFQNALLYLQVDIPLQQLLRSGSLIANLILSVVLLRKSYRWSKYVSVVMISFGISIATVASANQMTHWQDVGTSDRDLLVTYSAGVFVLLLAFYFSAYMGIYQEVVFNQHGKYAYEALYYNHVLPLPVFVFLTKDIVYYIQQFNQSELVIVPLFDIVMPKFWLYLIGNVLTQYVCISSVFILTAECSSLTVNLVVTLRKFFSLIFSVIYFNNAFTFFHWTGTVLVFGGTLLFSGVFSSYSCNTCVVKENGAVVANGTANNVSKVKSS